MSHGGRRSRDERKALTNGVRFAVAAAAAAPERLISRTRPQRANCAQPHRTGSYAVADRRAAKLHAGDAISAARVGHVRFLYALGRPFVLAQVVCAIGTRPTKTPQAYRAAFARSLVARVFTYLRN